VTVRQTLTITALLMTAGCFKLARVTPPLEQYVLGTTAPAPPAAPAATVRDSVGLTIGVRRLDLAPYLATPSIVVRRGARIETSEFRRWGEDPAAGISRAFARYLGAEPRIGAVDVAPWAARSSHDYVVQLHVTRLEGVAPEDTAATSGEVHLLTSWEIVRPQDGAVVARGESDHREKGWRVGDYASLVALLDGGLARVSRDVAVCLVRVVPPLPPVDSVELAKPLAC
jgi:uncharacterized lipoprotein YmbA